jgi:endonuclease/exonuclease/phosphatase family metal-dependent hydrolase
MKIFIKSIVSIIAIAILVVASYIGYVYLQYHRIPDNQKLIIKNNQNTTPEIGKSYSMMTFNIGYGSYPADYTFFMDGGKEVRARSKKDVVSNINEDIRLIKNANPDIVNIQEVDYQGDRSMHVSEPKMFSTAFASYTNIFVQNYDSAYLFYPVLNPIGKAKSGIQTLTKFAAIQSTRYQLPIETNFSKFFDLDRAFSVTVIPIQNSNKKLYLYNTHMSAFIKDKVIQAKQLTKIFGSMQKHVDNGDYVIAGADFNHVLSGAAHPELTWMKPFPVKELTKGMRVVAPTNQPSVRSNGVPYTSPKEITGIIDGFLVSDNISTSDVKTIQNNFKSSDHNPVVMKFTLK